MPNPTFKLINSVTVGAGGQASIDFTSIPSTYTDLCLEISVRDTGGSAWNAGKITFNSSATGYSGRNVYGAYGTTVGSDTYSFTGAGIYFPTGGGGSTANTFNNCSVYIPNYTSANNKSASLDSVAENNSSSGIDHLNAVLWSNTAAITQITLTTANSPFVQYSTAYLYGISKN